MAKETVSVSLRIEKDLHDRLEEQLDYGDSKSEWIRKAIEMKLKEGQMDDQDTKKNATE